MNASSVRIVLIYRPPPSKANGLKTSVFHNEWPTFLSTYVLEEREVLILGDLNFHLDIPDDPDTQRFMSTLASCGLQQHVREPTHIHGHTLDVLITRDCSSIISDIDVSDPGLCDFSGKKTKDHFVVSFFHDL